MNPTPNVTLLNGRTVTHKPQENGSQLAVMLDGNPMDANEWDAYCAELGKLTAAERAHRDAVTALHALYEHCLTQVPDMSEYSRTPVIANVMRKARRALEANAVARKRL